MKIILIRKVTELDELLLNLWNGGEDVYRLLEEQGIDPGELGEFRGLVQSVTG